MDDKYKYRALYYRTDIYLPIIVMLAALQTYKQCIHCVDHVNDNEVRLLKLLDGS